MNEQQMKSIKRLNEIGCYPLVPPALGCDIEHQSFIQGMEESDGEASRLVLGEIQGFSADNLYRSWSLNFESSRDWGRKYHPSGSYYIDLKKIETATNITLSARDQIANILAMRQLINEARKRAEEDSGKKIYVLACLNDRQENKAENLQNNYWGCHVNVCLSAKAFSELFSETNGQKSHLLYRFWLPAIVTSQIISGSGCVSEEGFILSDRVMGFRSVIGDRTTYDRPLICQRDESHAEPMVFSRLMTIHLDNNMSEVQTLCKLGNLQLDALMLEAAAFDLFQLPDLTLTNPLRAINTVTIDPTKPISLASGKSTTGIDLQKIIWETRCRFIRYFNENFCDMNKIVPDYKEIVRKTEIILNKFGSHDELIPWHGVFGCVLRNGPCHDKYETGRHV